MKKNVVPVYCGEDFDTEYHLVSNYFSNLEDVKSFFMSGLARWIYITENQHDTRKSFKNGSIRSSSVTTDSYFLKRYHEARLIGSLHDVMSQTFHPRNQWITSEDHSAMKKFPCIKYGDHCQLFYFTIKFYFNMSFKTRVLKITGTNSVVGNMLSSSLSAEERVALEESYSKTSVITRFRNWAMSRYQGMNESKVIAESNTACETTFLAGRKTGDVIDGKDYLSLNHDPVVMSKYLEVGVFKLYFPTESCEESKSNHLDVYCWLENLKSTINIFDVTKREVALSIAIEEDDRKKFYDDIIEYAVVVDGANSRMLVVPTFLLVNHQEPNSSRLYNLNVMANFVDEHSPGVVDYTVTQFELFVDRIFAVKNVVLSKDTDGVYDYHCGILSVPEIDQAIADNRQKTSVYGDWFVDAVLSDSDMFTEAGKVVSPAELSIVNNIVQYDVFNTNREAIMNVLTPLGAFNTDETNTELLIRSDENPNFVDLVLSTNWGDGTYSFLVPEITDYGDGSIVINDMLTIPAIANAADPKFVTFTSAVTDQLNIAFDEAFASSTTTANKNDQVAALNAYDDGGTYANGWGIYFQSNRNAVYDFFIPVRYELFT